ncbi:hypothetical protein [Palleronia sediminis]|nr:hypothetical protein [Palleronia sediminis]
MTYRFAITAPVFLLAALSVAGCAQMRGDMAPQGAEATAPGAAPHAPGAAPSGAPAEIAAVVSAPEPPAAARTAADFDTVTDAQKAAATAAPTGGEERLGEVVASLGDPTEPGLWLKTGLVTEPTSGRVEVVGSGASGVVELRPDPGDGAQLSIAAMRLLNLGLTDLPTIAVYRN